MAQPLHLQQDPKLHGANRCFGCGAANPTGLHLEFLLAEDHSVVSQPVISNVFEGHPGYLHGGIIATLLDETMSKAVRARGFVSMTRHMEVDYLRPVPSGAPLRLEGRVTHNEGRKHWAEAKILNAHGSLLAQAKGLFVEARPR
ncbi:MAG TPA: PaaI family thioesterase [Dongiaceae bacterium]|nr:PaaI family thioesterase [Dongiaceae bacterium]